MNEEIREEKYSDEPANESDVISLIRKIQKQMVFLERKIDTLLEQSSGSGKSFGRGSFRGGSQRRSFDRSRGGEGRSFGRSGGGDRPRSYGDGDRPRSYGDSDRPRRYSGGDRSGGRGDRKFGGKKKFFGRSRD